MDTGFIESVRRWIADDPDEATRDQAQHVLDDALSGDEAAVAQLRAWFGEFLQFGTAGLRGPLGPGPSCMNRAVVIRAAAGLINYLKARGAKRIVVGYDARHRSIDFALDTVAIADAAGFEAILLPRTLPTPVLAYSIRALNADAGVMVTASHNPAQDNGYKVYLGDGSQIVPPADADIAAEIAGVTSASSVPMSDRWESAAESVVDDYITATAAACQRVSVKIAVASTAMHGVGQETWSAVFDRVGFGTLHPVIEQAEPDPDFPTVAFPNPEEPGATDLLLELAARVSADVAIAHDPDADRCAVATVGRDGSWRLLRGDETGVLLGWWTIERTALFGLSKPAGSMAASIVSSTMLQKIAAAHNIPFHYTLTGFKWIAKISDLLFGYEEALGYCVDPTSVRDKDGISAAVRVCEMVSYLKSVGRTIEDVLDQLAAEYGLHATDQLSVRMSDLAAIPAAVSRLRTSPPSIVAGLPVTDVIDLAHGWNGLPPTDGMLLQLSQGRIIVRPSGTEPKLKCYLEAVPTATELTAARAEAHQLLTAMKSDMKTALGV